MPKKAHPCDQELVAYCRGHIGGKRDARLKSHFGRCRTCYDRMYATMCRLYPGPVFVDGHLDVDDITMLALGTLTEDQTSKAIQHLKSCSHCRGELGVCVSFDPNLQVGLNRLKQRVKS